jgi:hypothetical protein
MQKTMTTEANTTETCPQCEGTSFNTAIMCGPKAAGGEKTICRTTVRACDFCGGLRIVEAATADHWRRGAALHRKRVHEFGLTGEQLARWLHISPMLLNVVEWDPADLPPHADALQPSAQLTRRTRCQLTK